MNEENRNRLIDSDGCQRGEGLEAWVKKVKGLRSTDWQLQNGHGEVTFSTGNTVNSIVVTMYGASWVLKINIGETAL